ncbi:hypothetical protein GWI34_21460 [Actinomadura sp. DSM 109109]|nr:hypothetical protein [Actinomadura lepetitiana]
MDLPKWDTSTTRTQDQTIGRRRDSGAPLSGGHEFSAPDLRKTGADGRPLIPADSHLMKAFRRSDMSSLRCRRTNSSTPAAPSSPSPRACAPAGTQPPHCSPPGNGTVDPHGRSHTRADRALRALLRPTERPIGLFLDPGEPVLDGGRPLDRGRGNTPTAR